MPHNHSADLAVGDLDGDLTIIGRLADSSNDAMLVQLTERPEIFAIYKPIGSERPLWDFPEGTLAGREVAAQAVSRIGGWDLVPRTVLRDGPLGPGSVQRWVGNPLDPLPEDHVVRLVPGGAVPDGWAPVFDGETPRGAAVTVVHELAPDVRALAVLDAVLNNSDRKGSHCLRDESGRLWAIDHGVCFSGTPKLRTVLWGWAGDPIDEANLGRLHRLADALDRTDVRSELGALLPEDDVDALEDRVTLLLDRGRHPLPSPDWPPVPWPPL